MGRDTWRIWEPATRQYLLLTPAHFRASLSEMPRIRRLCRLAAAVFHSFQRICVEHANAEHKQWRTLQRYLGRREDFDETYMAVAGLVSDRAAER